MESSQDVQELENSPVLVSEKGTLSDVPEDGPSRAEHVNLEEPQETPLIAPGDHADVPDAIAWMMQNGVDFSRTKDSWHLSEDNVSLKKPFSVYFTLETPCSHNDIVMGLVDAGVEYEDILSIQRRLSTSTWVIALRSVEAKCLVLSAWYILIAGQRVLLADCDNRVQLVKIYNSPNEMPDSVIIGRLSAYGTVLSFRRDLAADSIFNGIRTARMRVTKNIPSTVRIAREFIRIWYPGQPKACRRCGDLGHLIKDCTSVRCFNCEESGHRADECEMPILCSICLSDGHRERHCPYVIFSANVESEQADVIPPSSYASAARTPRVPAPQIILDPDPTPEKRMETATEQTKAKEKEKEREKEKTRKGSKDEEKKDSTEHRRSSGSKSHGSHEHGRESRERRDDERERERERDRERERERERERARDRSRHHHHHRHEHSRDDDRHRDRDRDRDRHRDHRDRGRDRDRPSSSSDDSTDSDEEWIPVRGKHSKSKR